MPGNYTHNWICQQTGKPAPVYEDEAMAQEDATKRGHEVQFCGTCAGALSKMKPGEARSGTEAYHVAPGSDMKG